MKKARAIIYDFESYVKKKRLCNITYADWTVLWMNIFMLYAVVTGFLYFIYISPFYSFIYILVGIFALFVCFHSTSIVLIFLEWKNLKKLDAKQKEMFIMYPALNSALLIGFSFFIVLGASFVIKIICISISVLVIFFNGIFVTRKEKYLIVN